MDVLVDMTKTKLPEPSYFKNLLVLDIETVPVVPRFDELSPALQKLWEHKAQFMLQKEPERTAADLFEDRGGIYAEFGKIVTISVGFFYFNDDHELSLRVKAIANDDEKVLLAEFCELVNTKFNAKRLTFIAHNGKEFDFPYIGRRLLIQQMPIPDALELRDKKPWEIQHLDTMELWKFGDRKNFTQLALLAAVFGLPTSKGDIDGSQVRTVYYEENDLPRIAHYCNEDVKLTAQVFLRLMGWATMKEENITLL
ncbi:MAG: ribonuclease H-like domain-containing protein [Bacteroidota bacterium]